MREAYKSIPALYPDPAVYFLGTDEEIERAEMLDAENAAAWNDIITAPDFIGLEFEAGRPGRSLLLTRSLYDGVDLQLTWCDAAGPVMHENHYFSDLGRLFSSLRGESGNGATVHVLYS